MNRLGHLGNFRLCENKQDVLVWSEFMLISVVICFLHNNEVSGSIPHESNLTNWPSCSSSILLILVVSTVYAYVSEFCINKVKQVSQLSFSPSSVVFDCICVWYATYPLLKDCTYISRSHTFLYFFLNIFISTPQLSVWNTWHWILYYFDT
jgi:hypothetical protein